MVAFKPPTYYCHPPAILPSSPPLAAHSRLLSTSPTPAWERSGDEMEWYQDGRQRNNIAKMVPRLSAKFVLSSANHRWLKYPTWKAPLGIFRFNDTWTKSCLVTFTPPSSSISKTPLFLSCSQLCQSTQRSRKCGKSGSVQCFDFACLPR